MDSAHTKTLDRGVEALPMFEGAAAIEIEPVVRRVPVRSHLRRVDGPPAPTGDSKKKAALDAHELDRVKALAIEHVRGKLAELYRTREMQPMRFPIPFVNADDIARILADWPHRPKLLDTIDGTWKGAIMRKGFVMTGQSDPSLRPHMNGTRLPRWRLK